ncbi:MAG: hypothetical protein IIA87_04475 [Nanoarchaeota archaeon]|nr:hypothetical protein [Nanoarchaeota archaeon]
MKETKKKPKYVKPILVRLPAEVYKALKKRVQHKQKVFGRYSEADIARTAIVNHLKRKGYLKTGKDYL